MKSIAIAFSTKDRAELTKQSVVPLIREIANVNLYWIDGSTTEQGKQICSKYASKCHRTFTNVRGGSGAAIVFALTEMLKQPYEYVGLVENDVLLPKNWFAKTMQLFEKGKADGLSVGAVSARTYEDRILAQRDGYAVMHNLGAGMVIFTRDAARLVLDTYRTQWTTENRTTFAQFIGNDIGAYWAFRGSEHWLCADWRWDAVLATHGYASLGCTPSFVEMIGQVPSLIEQGLIIAKKPIEHLNSDLRFGQYVDTMQAINLRKAKLHTSGLFQNDATGGQMIFAHQISAIGGEYVGDWTLRDSIGFGPFGWKCKDTANCLVRLPILGPSALFFSGGQNGGEVEVIDKSSGFNARPKLPPEGTQGVVVPIAIPVHISYRTVTARPLTSGVTFYGLRCRDPQPTRTDYHFDFSVLPPVE